jgi:tetratricopeptide (TPR) repeat protein
MTSDKSQPTLQSIIKNRQQAAFVGREAQLDSFRRNLNLPVEDPQRRFILNVYGQGGVGKSTLLQQFNKIATESAMAVATAFSTESEENVLEVMACIAAQLKELNYPLKTFSERYHVYRQKRQEIEADPESPKSLPAFIGRSMVKVSTNLGRALPVVGVGLSLINEDALAEQAGDLVAYLARKLTNKDEVLLVREPIETLTPLFLADLRGLAKAHTIVLFFDTYEHTRTFLEGWLLNLLEGTYGDIPSNIMLIIAGRDQLDSNIWSQYEGVLCYQHLDAFGEEEFKAYLSRRGITNEGVAEEIERLTGRLPLLVAILATGNPTTPLIVDDPSETAIGRFLKWGNDPRQRQLALDAALPRWLNQDILTVLVDEDTEGSFTWLKGNPFVVARPDAWIYHEVARNQMLRYKLRESPQGWMSLHKRLATYHEGLRDALQLNEEKRWSDVSWQRHALETLYHRLCQSPLDQLEEATSGFISALKGDWSFPRRWAETVEQAGRDVQAADVQRRGRQMAEVVKAYTDRDYIASAEAFTAILCDAGSDVTWCPLALGWRGYIYYLTGQTQKALVDLGEAIRLAPADPEHWTYRGLTHAEAGRYEEALADLNRALELKPTYEKAIVGRGRIYIETGRDAEALADIDRAIELNPNDMGLLIVRLCFLLKTGDSAELGKTYIAMAMQSSKLVEQAQDMQEGFSKIPFEVLDRHLRRWGLSLGMDEGTIHIMLTQWRDLASAGPSTFTKVIKAMAAEAEAIMYTGNKQFDEALAACDKAIELCPSDAHLWFRRGEVYRWMNSLPEAIKDYDLSLNINPNDVETLARRGQLHQALRNYSEALIDFERALELKPEHPILLSMRQALLDEMASVKTKEHTE